MAFKRYADAVWQGDLQAGKGSMSTPQSGLFAEQTALKLNEHQLAILHEAAKSDWKHVEPAIFGTLLLGARTELFGLQADIGTSLTVGQRYGNDATLFVSIGGGF